MSRDLFERHGSIRLLIYLVIVIAVMVLGGMIWQAVAHYQDVIILLFLAWIIAFTLHPLSLILQRKGMPRTLAVATIYVALLALAIGSIFLAIPTIRVQVSRLAIQLNTQLSPANVQALTARLAGVLQYFGLTARDAQTLLRQLTDGLPKATGDLTNRVVAGAEAMVGTAMTAVMDAVLITIISFYMMLDGGRLFERLVNRLPPAWIPDVRLFQRHVDAAFGGFLRAALVITAVYAALNWVALAALGHPGGLLFALLAGMLLVVPIIGPVVAMVPPVLLIALDSPSSVMLRDLVIVIVVLFIAQQVTMQLVAPRVMSAHVGLPPLVFFIALLVGLREAGVWGALFAGPVAAVVLAMADTFFERWRLTSGLYPEAEPMAVGSLEAEPFAEVRAPPGDGPAEAVPAEGASTGAAPSEAAPDGREPEPERHPVETGT